MRQDLSVSFLGLMLSRQMLILKLVDKSIILFAVTQVFIFMLCTQI